MNEETKEEEECFWISMVRPASVSGSGSGLGAAGRYQPRRHGASAAVGAATQEVLRAGWTASTIYWGMAPYY